MKQPNLVKWKYFFIKVLENFFESVTTNALLSGRKHRMELFSGWRSRYIKSSGTDFVGECVVIESFLVVDELLMPLLGLSPLSDDEPSLSMEEFPRGLSQVTRFGIEKSGLGIDESWTV